MKIEPTGKTSFFSGERYLVNFSSREELNEFAHGTVLPVPTPVGLKAIYYLFLRKRVEDYPVSIDFSGDELNFVAEELKSIARYTHHMQPELAVRLAIHAENIFSAIGKTSR